MICLDVDPEGKSSWSCSSKDNTGQWQSSRGLMISIFIINDIVDQNLGKSVNDGHLPFYCNCRSAMCSYPVANTCQKCGPTFFGLPLGKYQMTINYIYPFQPWAGSHFVPMIKTKAKHDHISPPYINLPSLHFPLYSVPPPSFNFTLLPLRLP